MKYSVAYCNENSFMKEWAGSPTIKQTIDGKDVSTGMTYRKSNVPGTVVNFAPKFQEGKGMLIKMTQDELNKAVVELSIYDNKGQQITSAPLGTQNHDFWKSEHAYLFIEAGHIDLDDSKPKDRIMLNAMRMDNHFYFKGETNKPPVKSVVRWMVTPIDGKHAAVVEDEGDSIKASKFLNGMDYETQLYVAKILGKEMAEKTDPDILYATLFRCITSERDLFVSEGVTYLQKFLQLAQAGNSELNLEALANECKAHFIKKGGIYWYGEIRMGKSMSEVVKKLKEDPDLLDELDKLVKKKK